MADQKIVRLTPEGTKPKKRFERPHDWPQIDASRASWANARPSSRLYPTDAERFAFVNDSRFTVPWALCLAPQEWTSAIRFALDHPNRVMTSSAGVPQSLYQARSFQEPDSELSYFDETTYRLFFPNGFDKQLAWFGRRLIEHAAFSRSIRSPYRMRLGNSGFWRDHMKQTVPYKVETPWGAMMMRTLPLPEDWADPTMQTTYGGFPHFDSAIQEMFLAQYIRAVRFQQQTLLRSSQGLQLSDLEHKLRTEKLDVVGNVSHAEAQAILDARVAGLNEGWDERQQLIATKAKGQAGRLLSQYHGGIVLGDRVELAGMYGPYRAPEVEVPSRVLIQAGAGTYRGKTDLGVSYVSCSARSAMELFTREGEAGDVAVRLAEIDDRLVVLIDPDSDLPLGTLDEAYDPLRPRNKPVRMLLDPFEGNADQFLGMAGFTKALGLVSENMEIMSSVTERGDTGNAGLFRDQVKGGIALGYTMAAMASRRAMEWGDFEDRAKLLSGEAKGQQVVIKRARLGTSADSGKEVVHHVYAEPWSPDAVLEPAMYSPAGSEPDFQYDASGQKVYEQYFRLALEPKALEHLKRYFEVLCGRRSPLTNEYLLKVQKHWASELQAHKNQSAAFSQQSERKIEAAQAVDVSAAITAFESNGKNSEVELLQALSERAKERRSALQDQARAIVAGNLDFIEGESDKAWPVEVALSANDRDEITLAVTAEIADRAQGSGPGDTENKTFEEWVQQRIRKAERKLVEAKLLEIDFARIADEVKQYVEEGRRHISADRAAERQKAVDLAKESARQRVVAELAESGIDVPALRFPERLASMNPEGTSASDIALQLEAIVYVELETMASAAHFPSPLTGKRMDFEMSVETNSVLLAQMKEFTQLLRDGHEFKGPDGYTLTVREYLASYMQPLLDYCDEGVHGRVKPAGIGHVGLDFAKALEVGAIVVVQGPSGKRSPVIAELYRQSRVAASRRAADERRRFKELSPAERGDPRAIIDALGHTPTIASASSLHPGLEKLARAAGWPTHEQHQLIVNNELVTTSSQIDLEREVGDGGSHTKQYLMAPGPQDIVKAAPAAADQLENATTLAVARRNPVLVKIVAFAAGSWADPRGRVDSHGRPEPGMEGPRVPVHNPGSWWARYGVPALLRMAGRVRTTDTVLPAHAMDESSPQRRKLLEMDVANARVPGSAAGRPGGESVLYDLEGAPNAVWRTQPEGALRRKINDVASACQRGLAVLITPRMGLNSGHDPLPLSFEEGHGNVTVGRDGFASYAEQGTRRDALRAEHERVVTEGHVPDPRPTTRREVDREVKRRGRAEASEIKSVARQRRAAVRRESGVSMNSLRHTLARGGMSLSRFMEVVGVVHRADVAQKQQLAELARGPVDKAGTADRFQSVRLAEIKKEVAQTRLAPLATHLDSEDPPMAEMVQEGLSASGPPGEIGTTPVTRTPNGVGAPANISAVEVGVDNPADSASDRVAQPAPPAGAGREATLNGVDGREGVGLQ